MNKKIHLLKRSNGSTIQQILFALLIFFIFVGIVLFIIEFPETQIGKKIIKPINNKKPNLNTKYQCLTTPDGKIPIKVIIINPKNAVCYQYPDVNSAKIITVDFLNFYFLFNKEKSKSGVQFFKIGADPYSSLTIGWLKNEDTILWNNRQAFRPLNLDKRKPIYAWKNPDDIGDLSKADFKEITQNTIENINEKPFLLLSSKDSNYKFVIDWELKSDINIKGVDIGWTKLDNIPIEIVYYIRKHELENKIEKLNKRISDIIHDKYSDNPMIKLFSDNFETIFGKGIDFENKGLGFFHELVKHIPKVPEFINKHPDEIKKDIVNLKYKLSQMKNFLENKENWNDKGGSWIPDTILPGN